MQSPSSQSSLHRTQVLHQAHNCLTLIPQILSVHIIPHAAYGKDLSPGVSVRTKMLTNYDLKNLNLLRVNVLISATQGGGNS